MLAIFLEKVDTLNLESQNLDKNISQSSPIKIWGKSVKGFLSYERKNKQTDKQRLQLYMLEISNNRMLIYRGACRCKGRYSSSYFQLLVEERQMGSDFGKREKFNTFIFKGTVIVILIELLIKRGACQIYNSILLIFI